MREAAAAGLTGATVCSGAAHAGAQAPVPRVTITGLIDNVLHYNSNQGLNLADRLGCPE